MKYLLLLLLVMSCGWDLGGTKGEQGPPGEAVVGERGHAGTDGKDGKDGIPCTVIQVEASSEVPNGGAKISCSGSSDVVILNGTNGQNAEAYLITLVNPCADTRTGAEYFIRFPDGTLFASFSDNSNGKNTRLSKLFPGNFITTDGFYCYFTIDSNNQIVNAHF